MSGAAAGGLGSAAESKPGEHTRFPCFDGFRAIAALSVLTTHVAAFSSFHTRSRLGALTARLDVGVAIFFVISGFLLYRPFVAARLAKRSAPRAPAFYWRRALRIFPAYWFALTIVVYVLDASAVPIRGAKDFVLYFGLLHVYSDDPAHFFSPIAQAWTLTAELTFYLLLPIWAWLMATVARRSCQRLRGEIVGLSTLFGASVLFYVTVAFSDLSAGRKGQLLHSFPAWLDLFAVGMALAVFSAWLEARREDPPAGLDRPLAPAVCWSAAAVAFLTVSVWIGRPPNPAQTAFTAWEDVGVHYLYGATALFLLLPGVFGPQDEGFIRGLLRNRVVQALGLVSYGIYLWHEALITKYVEWRGFDSPLYPVPSPFWEMLAATLAATVVAATISYVVVEKPALRLKRWLPLQPPERVAPAIEKA